MEQKKRPHDHPTPFSFMSNANNNMLSLVTGQMGLITPPVGRNVFVIKGAAPEVPLNTIFKGVFPYVAAILACITIQLFFPQIALFLHNLMMEEKVPAVDKLSASTELSRNLNKYVIEFMNRGSK